MQFVFTQSWYVFPFFYRPYSKQVEVYRPLDEHDDDVEIRDSIDSLMILRLLVRSYFDVIPMLFRCYSDVIPAFHPIILVSLRVRFSRTDWSSRAFTYVFDFFNYVNLCTSVFFDGTSPCACRRVELYVQS